MPITNAHLNWFKLKCPYPVNSTAYATAEARLNNATYPDLERLRAEFDEYQDGSIPGSHKTGCYLCQSGRRIDSQARCSGLWCI